MIDVYLQEENGDQQLENPTSETEIEKEGDEIEEENNDEEEEDVQSFVTALENENDHVTDSINDLHLGHDDDGEKFHVQISNSSIFSKVGLLHRMSKLSNQEP